MRRLESYSLAVPEVESHSLLFISFTYIYERSRTTESSSTELQTE